MYPYDRVEWYGDWITQPLTFRPFEGLQVDLPEESVQYQPTMMKTEKGNMTTNNPDYLNFNQLRPAPGVMCELAIGGTTKPVTLAETYDGQFYWYDEGKLIPVENGATQYRLANYNPATTRRSRTTTPRESAEGYSATWRERLSSIEVGEEKFYQARNTKEKLRMSSQGYYAATHMEGGAKFKFSTGGIMGVKVTRLL